MSQNKIDWLTESSRRKFRVKIKSLAEEAKIIRSEEKRLKSQDEWAVLTRGELHSHRTWSIRREQRATFLAYAYWKGVPYRKVESTTRKPIPVKRIKEILKSLGRDYDPKVEEWLSADLVSN